MSAAYAENGTVRGPFDVENRNDKDAGDYAHNILCELGVG